jgi:hypothetical protein
MDPATIGFLISIAPTVLDLLFGQGHIKESSRQQRYPLENMYGYALKVTVIVILEEEEKYQLLKHIIHQKHNLSLFELQCSIVQLPRKILGLNIWKNPIFTKMFENYYSKQGQPTNQKIQ